MLPPLLVIGLGHVMPSALGAATAGVTAADAGAASATVNTVQQVGGPLGTALLYRSHDAKARHHPTTAAHL